MLPLKTILKTSYIIKTTFKNNISPPSMKYCIYSYKAHSGGWILIRKNQKNLEISSTSLTYSLTTVAKLETKQSSTRSLFYDTKINSVVGCAFWGYDECAPFAPCHSFYLPLSLSFSLSNKTTLTC